ncbi:MAG: AMP-binding protein, partial [Pseudomonadota bacterium]|nr:AMP-binding protein [Pseudomonadota bacterium]
MLQPTGNYDALRETFRWPRPATYNMAAAVSDEWAARDPERLAIRQVLENGSCRDWSHLALNRAANRLANALEGLGLNRGDRVALLLPQIPQTAIAHLATYKTGAIAVPLAALFGLEALRYRLSDSGARVLVTDTAGLAKLAEIRSDLPGLDLVISVDGPETGVFGFEDLLDKASD